MSRTLKVAGSQVMNDHGAWFPRVIFSSLRTSCCLLICIFFNKFRNKWSIPPIVGTISFFIFCIIKQLLDSVFVISRIIKVLVRVISLQMIILDITKTSSSNYLMSSLDFGLGVLEDSRKLGKSNEYFLLIIFSIRMLQWKRMYKTQPSLWHLVHSPQNVPMHCVAFVWKAQIQTRKDCQRNLYTAHSVRIVVCLCMTVFWLLWLIGQLFADVLRKVFL